jgi:diguanylate cyclase (GGDEF)-like protein
LKQIATAIQATFRRPTDIAVRFGGEEFIVLLPDTEAKAAHTLGGALRGRVADLRIPHSESRRSKGYRSASVAHPRSPNTAIQVSY